MKLELLSKELEFTNEKGEIIKYTRYYVLYNGIEIYLKPMDKTSKQLLKMAFNK